jgi:outer membrane lipoprotein-sorting protein
MEPLTLTVRSLRRIAAAAAFAGLLSGCSVKHTTVVKPSEAPAPARTATKAQLIEQYNRQASAITSLNATVTMKFSAGSAYTGVIDQYHEIKGFILAQKPSNIRVIGQAPIISKDIFDMESDGETFHIFIPSKNQFLVGSANLERPSAKPIENLRPQHLVDSIFWQPIPAASPVLFEEANEGNSRFYVLTVVRHPAAEGSPDLEIAEKIWFDRADLKVSRIETYDVGGKLGSDIHYGDWESAGAAEYPHQISLNRPASDYDLQIGITKLSLNEPIDAEHFLLAQPPGTQLIRVGDETSSGNTSGDKGTENSGGAGKQESQP